MLVPGSWTTHAMQGEEGQTSCKLLAHFANQGLKAPMRKAKALQKPLQPQQCLQLIIKTMQQ
jgi:hypothetical protein